MSSEIWPTGCRLAIDTAKLRFFIGVILDRKTSRAAPGRFGEL